MEFLSYKPIIRIWIAIIISNLIFAMTHLHISLGVAVVVFIAGVFLGWLYSFQRSIVSVSIIHILLGIWGFFILGFEYLF